jgi:uncharacterized C2H2 Zn-finger protein
MPTPQTKKVCPICGKSVVNLQRHTKEVHTSGISGNTLFMCNTCGQRFKRQEAYTRHRRKVHGDASSTSSLAPVLSELAAVSQQSSPVSSLTQQQQQSSASLPSTSSHSPATLQQQSVQQQEERSSQQQQLVDADLFVPVDPDFVDYNKDLDQYLPPGFDPLEHYSLTEVFSRWSRDLQTKVNDYVLRFEPLVWTSLVEAEAQLQAILKEILDEVKSHSPAEHAKIRVCIRSEQLAKPIQNKYTNMKNLSANSLTNLFIMKLQSNEDFDLSLCTMNILFTAMPAGGTSNYLHTKLANRRVVNLDSWIQKKKCILDVCKNIRNDKWCLPRTIVAGVVHARFRFMHEEKNPKALHSEWRRVSWGNKGARAGVQGRRAWELIRASGLKSSDGPFSLMDLAKFQEHLKDHRIICYNGYGDMVFKGDVENHRNIFILHHDDHFYLITSPSRFLMREKGLCQLCLRGYNSRSGQHRCEQSLCEFCRQVDCENKIIKKWQLPIDESYCENCERPFKTVECYNCHLKTGLCETVAMCSICRTVVKRTKLTPPTSHDCMKPFCTTCQKRVEMNHRCFMAKIESSSESCVEKQPPTVYYADFESCLDENDVHKPCLLIFQREDGTRERVLFGEDCHIRYVQMLIEEDEFYNTTHIFHGLGIYDGLHILAALHHLRIAPEVLFRHNRILTMMLKNRKIRFLDTLNFLPIKLASFPKAFGIPGDGKQRFPHLFNRKENWDYCQNSLPPVEGYDAKHLTLEEYRDFMLWYANEEARYKTDPTLLFDFKSEMILYCRQDVVLLRLGAESFRNILKTTFSNYDPFQEAITLPSYCNRVYRKFYMERDSIPLLPVMGITARKQQSTAAYLWLYVKQKELSHDHPGYRIRHSGNSAGEVKVGPFYVDGFLEMSGLTFIYEFHGCWFHYHDCKWKPERADHRWKIRHKFERTLEREEYFRSFPEMRLISIWECEFYRWMNSHPEKRRLWAVKKEILNAVKEEPLRMRNALRGGKVEATAVHSKPDLSKGESISYVDFISLYPSVMLSLNVKEPELWFKGWPTIYWFPAETPPLRELLPCCVAKVRILPPRRLYHPILPIKMKDRVLFSLCSKCAELGGGDGAEGYCTHSTRERAITGTFVGCELQQALEFGYCLLDVYEVYAWEGEEAHSREMFAGFLKEAVRMKVTSSGYPKNVDTLEKQTGFLRSYREHPNVNMRIDIQLSDMKPNPTLKTTGKFLVNSFWGFFARSEQVTKFEYIKNFAELSKIIFDSQREITEIDMVGDDMLIVGHQYKMECTKPLKSVSSVVGCQTTAFARIKLNSELQLLGRSALYFDTDSLIIAHKPGQYLPSLGEKIGELSCEILSKYGDDAEVVEFFATGAKSYVLIVRKKSTGELLEPLVRVKGCKLSVINVEEKNLNVQGMANVAVKDEKLILDHQILSRNRRTATIQTKQLTKTFQRTMTKRIVKHDLSTVPFGWCE